MCNWILLIRGFNYFVNKQLGKTLVILQSNVRWVLSQYSKFHLVHSNPWTPLCTCLAHLISAWSESSTWSVSGSNKHSPPATMGVIPYIIMGMLWWQISRGLTRGVRMPATRANTELTPKPFCLCRIKKIGLLDL